MLAVEHLHHGSVSGSVPQIPISTIKTIRPDKFVCDPWKNYAISLTFAGATERDCTTRKLLLLRADRFRHVFVELPGFVLMLKLDGSVRNVIFSGQNLADAVRDALAF
jgi:hypothetical protein